jgi:hypothetical protein
MFFPVTCLTFADQGSVAVAGNTTCPASDVAMTEIHLRYASLLIQQYGAAISPFHLCPPVLFVELIRINHLRYLATIDKDPSQDLTQEAYNILFRICSFSSNRWADSKPSSKDKWTLMGNIYRAAAALYCILSLQSLKVLPDVAPLRDQIITLGKDLLHLIKEGLSSREIDRFMLWPLVVLGVCASRNSTTRAFVRVQLEGLSVRIGTYAPLTAKGVLEIFWSSGESRWDRCFDRPYAFTMQIAVDMSRISAT